MYIFTENNNTKNGKIKKEGKKELSRTQTWHLRIDATTPNHYTTEADYKNMGKSLQFTVMSFPWNFCRQDDQAAWTVLTVTVEKQCKRIFHGNEWMKEHNNYALQKPIHILVCKVRCNEKRKKNRMEEKICQLDEFYWLVLRSLIPSHLRMACFSH